jgi:hypothetical protein
VMFTTHGPRGAPEEFEAQSYCGARRVLQANPPSARSIWPLERVCPAREAFPRGPAAIWPLEHVRAPVRGSRAAAVRQSSRPATSRGRSPATCRCRRVDSRP